MREFPSSPGAAALARLEPRVRTLPAGSHVAHVYYTSSAESMAWNEFRRAASPDSRWDHHQPPAVGEAPGGPRAVYLAAPDAVTCLAQAFEQTRRIDRATHAPWLVVFKTARPVQLLDLTGDGALKIGASPAMHAATRGTLRAWARDLYLAYPTVEGILHPAPAHAMAPAFALNERTLRAPWFPPHPEFHRALADDLLLDPLKHAAEALGYALR